MALQSSARSSRLIVRSSPRAAVANTAGARSASAAISPASRDEVNAGRRAGATANRESDDCRAPSAEQRRWRLRRLLRGRRVFASASSRSALSARAARSRPPRASLPIARAVGVVHSKFFNRSRHRCRETRVWQRPARSTKARLRPSANARLARRRLSARNRLRELVPREQAPAPRESQRDD